MDGNIKDHMESNLIFESENKKSSFIQVFDDFKKSFNMEQ